MGKELEGNQWRATEVEDGIRHVTCENWSGFVSFVNETLLDHRTYIFRGHAVDSWSLQSTLDRALKIIPANKRAARSRLHLEGFKYAARGRRGLNPAVLIDENDWWALGQHHGLVTPLLDWTESPYVAAYFSFYQDASETTNRVVFALSRTSVEKRNKELIGANHESKLLKLVRPMSDENQRLINQRGLFTRAPAGKTIENWVSEQFPGPSDGAKLLRISIPNADRSVAMKNLNRMNINHISLFPDIYGAAKYCNHALQIDKY